MSDMSDGGGDDNSIKKVRNYDASYNTHEPLSNKPPVEFDASKKMDLDEDDITSSEGTSSIDVIAKDFEYVNMVNNSGSGVPDRQMGRRQQRLTSDYKPIEEEDSFPPAPIDSPQPYANGTYSPTFSNLDRSSYASDPNQSPLQKSPIDIRVRPMNQQQPQPQSSQARYYGQPSTSPSPLTQNVGLPHVEDSRSTAV
jgi:sushi domain-containing protein 2